MPGEIFKTNVFSIIYMTMCVCVFVYEYYYQCNERFDWRYLFVFHFLYLRQAMITMIIIDRNDIVSIDGVLKLKWIQMNWCACLFKFTFASFKSLSMDNFTTSKWIEYANSCTKMNERPFSNSIENVFISLFLFLSRFFDCTTKFPD